MKITNILLAVAVISCNSPKQNTKKYIAYTGITLIDGSGSAPVADAVLLISDGRVSAAGAKESVPLLDGTEVRDMSGKFVMPGIINAHGHVGETRGIEGGHYSAENIIDNLGIYARYGVTTVVSLGGDQAQSVPLRAVNDSTSTGRARLFTAGAVISGKNPAEAAPVVDKNHAMGVDFMKIRVDDNLGTSTKMGEEVYRAVIQRSHELGYKIATHMYYLEDARKLLEAGSDLIAHSIRDKPVDDGFIQLIKERKVCYCPTLTRELSTFVYGDTAAFFSDPFFRREFDSVTVQPLKDPLRQLQTKNNKNGQIYREQLPVAMANLKTLSDGGVPIAFGTDSGVPTRFMGYFEHIEMDMMAEAGLTPMQIIVSASKSAAECLQLKGLGTLTRGNWADFIILDANPLADIANVRKISAVYIGGVEVKR